MKSVLIIYIFLSLVSASLSAQDFYIKVKSVSNATLSNTLYDLNELGYKPYSSKAQGIYKIYVGPFKSNSSANRNLSIIQNNISREAFIVGASLNRKNIPKESDKKNCKSFFIGLSVGGSKLNMSEDKVTGDIDLDVDLKNSGLNYGLEGGYYFHKNIFMTLNYQRTDLSDLYINDLYTTLNYQFDDLSIVAPYLGLLAGYSLMNWDTYPVDSITEDPKGSSFMAGFQVGGDIDIAFGISLYIVYKYWITNFTTDVETQDAKTVIEHKDEQNLNLGIKYNF